MLKSGRKPVPFNYQPQITGAIHKWLGPNAIHDSTSLYSFSWLQGGHRKLNHLVFENGASFEFSAYNDDVVKSIIKGIQSDPAISFGLSVAEIILVETPVFNMKERLYVTSPVLVKRKIENREVHYTYEEPDSNKLLTETLKTKLRKAGLEDNNVEVGFATDYPGAKTKLIYYNKIGNKVNLCPVVIEGSPEQIAFAWNVGVGNSTGIGFGALK